MPRRKAAMKEGRDPPKHEAEPRYRSGAVARMLRMPVTTLRVWERRYALTRPLLSPSGQRLYGAADVQRLALLKQLTDLGHAIGSVAALDMAQLQAVAATHAQTLSRARTTTLGPIRGTGRVAVVGAALAARLQRPALRQRLGRQVQLFGPFDDVAQAAAAWQGAAPDLLLLHAPRLHGDAQATWRQQAPGWAAVPTAVWYGYASEAVCDALAAAGVALLREPQADAVLAQWLLGRLAVTPSAVQPAPAKAEAAPRRWSDAALADFAGLSSTIACECPRHVAELLMQLSHFEAYSADCESRGPADAELHAYLRRMAAAARAQFEAALEHVAQHEGLMLPG